jgi:hypothetical protein
VFEKGGVVKEGMARGCGCWARVVGDSNAVCVCFCVRSLIVGPSSSCVSLFVWGSVAQGIPGWARGRGVAADAPREARGEEQAARHRTTRRRTARTHGTPQRISIVIYIYIYIYIYILYIWLWVS